MNTLFKIIIILSAAVLPYAVSAKEMIGDYVLEYDLKTVADTNGDGTDDRTSYYKGDALIWSAYDENGDGKPDLWMRYKNGDTIDLELFDPDGDGEPDKITEFNAQEKAEVVYDNGAEFAGGGSAVNYVLIALVLAAAWFYRKYFILQIGKVFASKNRKASL